MEGAPVGGVAAGRLRELGELARDIAKESSERSGSTKQSPSRFLP